MHVWLQICAGKCDVTTVKSEQERNQLSKAKEDWMLSSVMVLIGNGIPSPSTFFKCLNILYLLLVDHLVLSLLIWLGF